MDTRRGGRAQRRRPRQLPQFAPYPPPPPPLPHPPLPPPAPARPAQQRHPQHRVRRLEQHFFNRVQQMHREEHIDLHVYAYGRYSAVPFRPPQFPVGPPSDEDLDPPTGQCPQYHLYFPLVRQAYRLEDQARFPDLSPRRDRSLPAPAQLSRYYLMEDIHVMSAEEARELGAILDLPINDVDYTVPALKLLICFALEELNLLVG